MNSRALARILAGLVVPLQRAGHLCIALFSMSFGCRIENPGFESEVAEELDPSQGRDDDSTASEQAPASSSEDDSTQSQSSDGSGTPDPASTSSSSQETQSASTSDQSSGSPGISTQANIEMCGVGEGHCYLLNKKAPSDKDVSNDGKGPELALIEDGMLLHRYINGPTGPFESYVDFVGWAILGMQSFISVSDLSGGQDFVGIDFVLRKPSCAFGATRCAFAQVANLVLSIDVQSKKFICSHFKADGTGIEAELSGPVLSDEVNRVGCGMLGQEFVMFVNGELYEMKKPEPASTLVQVKVQFGSGLKFFGEKFFLGEVGMLRYWNDADKMKAALEEP